MYDVHATAHAQYCEYGTIVWEEMYTSKLIEKASRDTKNKSKLTMFAQRTLCDVTYLRNKRETEHALY
jgi:hypothetical protein